MLPVALFGDVGFLLIVLGAAVMGLLIAASVDAAGFTAAEWTAAGSRRGYWTSQWVLVLIPVLLPLGLVWSAVYFLWARRRVVAARRAVVRDGWAALGVAVEPPARWRRSPAFVAPGVGILVTVLVSGTMVFGIWAMDHDMPMPGEPKVRVPVGGTAAAAFYLDVGGSVDVRAARVRVSENTADADVRVAYCRTPDYDYARLIGRIAEVCAGAPQPWRAGRVELGSGGVRLVALVTPHRPGRVHVTGLDYAWQDVPDLVHRSSETELTVETVD